MVSSPTYLHSNDTYANHSFGKLPACESEDLASMIITFRKTKRNGPKYTTVVVVVNASEYYQKLGGEDNT